MKITRYLFAFLFLSLSFSVAGQIETGETAQSFSQSADKQNSLNYSTVIADPNTSVLIAEDAVTDVHKDIPWRFGTAIPVNLTLNNSGEWMHDDNSGMSIWKLKISFQKALSINLNFGHFELSQHAKLFLYNQDRSDVLGAITAKNNKENKIFSTRPIKGNEITLELEIPQNELENNLININEVVYGYRSIHQKVQTIFQSSGNCNININCTEGDNWQDLKRSVAMITTASNTRFCTGTLINNVRQDSTPYILTAAHCGIQGNSIFIFGYESAQCNPNTDGILSNSISGSGRKAITVNFGSDFELRELSATPPLSYNVFYAGWDNQNVASTYSVGIHHPSGDVKKISIDRDAVTESGYYNSGVTHWQVSNWEEGTTEGGSSGSALFDANQRIIGQLHGGDAACGNSSQDYYGKFSRSWDFSTDTLRQLKHWLDPDNTGATVLDGLDPNPSIFAVDLDVLDIIGLDAFSCSQSSQFSINVKNLGNQTIDSLRIDYQLNNGPIQSIFHYTSVNRQGIVSSGTINLIPTNGTNTLVVSAQPLGLSDQDMSNNSDSINFVVNVSSSDQIILTFKTDDYGSESAWELKDDVTGISLYTSPGYPNANGGNVFIDSLCVYNGCFNFTIFDSQGDGFNDPSGTFGNGYALITKFNGDTLYFENNFRGSLTTDTFCTSFSTSIAEKLMISESLVVYPNPTQSGEKIYIQAGVQEITSRLFNSKGQIITTELGNEIQLPSNLPNGVYFLEVRSKNDNLPLGTKKVLVQ